MVALFVTAPTRNLFHHRHVDLNICRRVGLSASRHVGMSTRCTAAILDRFLRAITGVEMPQRWRISEVGRLSWDAAISGALTMGVGGPGDLALR